IANETIAEVNDASILGDAHVSIAAVDRSRIQTLSGAVVWAIGDGAGGAVTVNQIANTTAARLVGGNLGAGGSGGAPSPIGSLQLSAKSNATIESLAAGAGKGATVGAGGSSATNVMENETRASIEGGALLIAHGDVAVTAESDETVRAAAGAAGVGSSTLGVGASVAVNEIGGTTEARIRGAETAVTARGYSDAGGDESRGVQVGATSTHQVENVSVTLGGGAGAAAVTTTTSLLSGATRARVDEAEINGVPGDAHEAQSLHVL